MKKNCILFLFTLISMFGANVWALDPVNGVYQLATAQDVADFATVVDGGATDLKAVLTADIDMSGYPTCMIGNSKDKPFMGEFDGQGHTIKLAINMADDVLYSGALFRFAKDATFKNLNLTGSVTTAGWHPASLVSLLYGSGNSTITNVTSDCDIATNRHGACMGGLVGSVGDVWDNGGGINVTLNNCAFTGSLTNANVDGNNGGNFIGWKSTQNATVTVNNSYAAPKSITNSPAVFPFVRVLTDQDNGDIHFNRSYYLNDITDYAALQGSEGTPDQFASGEICYLMNGDQSTITWYQTIGTDAYPVLDASHGKVEKNEDGSYSTISDVEFIRTDMAADSKIYNLKGQRVEKAVKGIYIVNGKKLLVK